MSGLILPVSFSCGPGMKPPFPLKSSLALLPLFSAAKTPMPTRMAMKTRQAKAVPPAAHKAL